MELNLGHQACMVSSFPSQRSHVRFSCTFYLLLLCECMRMHMCLSWDACPGQRALLGVISSLPLILPISPNKPFYKLHLLTGPFDFSFPFLFFFSPHPLFLRQGDIVQADLQSRYIAEDGCEPQILQPPFPKW